MTSSKANEKHISIWIFSKHVDVDSKSKISSRIGVVSIIYQNILSPRADIYSEIVISKINISIEFPACESSSTQSFSDVNQIRAHPKTCWPKILFWFWHFLNNLFFFFPFFLLLSVKSGGKKNQANAKRISDS